MPKDKPKSDYEAEDIYVLEGLEPVRKRPGMYIGSTGVDGLHHLVWEVVDNGIDEAMAGYADEVYIVLHPGESVTVIDDGRGIPISEHPETKRSALETVMTTLHAGGKFGSDSYKVAGGLHGVGVSVVCALSEWLKASVIREGEVYTQSYERGEVKSELEKLGKASEVNLGDMIDSHLFADTKKGKKRLEALKEIIPDLDTGTLVSFKPDDEIFSTTEFKWKKLLEHLRQQSYLTKGLKINILDQRDSIKPKRYSFCFEGGIKSYVRYLLWGEEPTHESVFYTRKTDEEEDVLVEVALQYSDDLEGMTVSFANNINTGDGGMHLTGFKRALTRAVNEFAKEEDYIKEGEDNLVGRDVREGMVAVVSVKIKEPQFEGQTKAKLGNPEARSATEKVLYEEFKDFLFENPSEARSIMEKVLLARKARRAAKKAKETVIRKGAMSGLSLPGKLADCSSRDPEKTELFIVEGDSAGGCFSGDTKVALTDGRELTFRELVQEAEQGKKNYCYTIKQDGSIGIEKIKNPRVTKKDVEVVKVILDNDEEVVCTPDHKFMLRDGSYKQAQNLDPDDSLMPLRRQLSKLGRYITIKGYELVYDNKEQRWIFTHMLADDYNLEHDVYSESEGSHRHHIDFDKLNNNPDNITRMDEEEHMKYHTQRLDSTLHSEEAKEKARKAHQKKEYREKISKIMSTPEMKKMLSERAKKQWEDEEYKEYMKKKYMEFYENNKEYREKLLDRLNKAQEEYWNKEKNRKEQAERTREYFEENPEEKEKLAEMAEEQWEDSELLEWRSKKTKEQWTDEFRKKRKQAYNRTYYNSTIKLLRKIYEQEGEVDIEKYDAYRLDKNNPNLLRMDTFCDRFFDGGEERAIEAVKNYNHKVKKVENITEKKDVYDIEVPETHNFALASGVFVHNSSKQARDRGFQAVLPIKGKILNVEKARLNRILENKEIKSLIVALGTAIAEEFDLSEIRYNKIIIMTDADVDGAHIRTLLLTLFYRYFKPVIESGHLYIVEPPLYRIQMGKDVEYAYTEKERKKLLKKLNEKNKRFSLQRFKGLGEMSPHQLWDTSMDPETRVLMQVAIEDAQEADRVFDDLMGKDVTPRKKFLKSRAQEVENLDI